MDISKFQEINAERGIKWMHDDLAEWSLLEWCGAMCGEAGEAANYAKKLRRLDLQLPNKEAGIDINDETKLMDDCAKELADTIIYALLALSLLGVDASLLIKKIFNQKSIEYGFPERAPE